MRCRSCAATAVEIWPAEHMRNGSDAKENPDVCPQQFSFGGPEFCSLTICICRPVRTAPTPREIRRLGTKR